MWILSKSWNSYIHSNIWVLCLHHMNCNHLNLYLEVHKLPKCTCYFFAARKVLYLLLFHINNSKQCNFKVGQPSLLFSTKLPLIVDCKYAHDEILLFLTSKCHDFSSIFSEGTDKRRYNFAITKKRIKDVWEENQLRSFRRCSAIWQRMELSTVKYDLKIWKEFSHLWQPRLWD